MNKRKLYVYPSMIVIKLSVKDGLMDYQSQDPADVREQKGNFDNNDWETE